MTLIKKAVLSSLIFALNYFLFSSSITSNYFLSSSCSLAIALSVYIVMKSCIEVVTELNNRFTDYEALHLLIIRFIESLSNRRNLPSLLEEAYKMSYKRSEALLKAREMVKVMLCKKILKVKSARASGGTRPSSPLTRLALSLLEKLDFIDEISLRSLMISLHDLSFSLCLNAKKLRDLIAVEKLKYRVLQIASAMALGFIIKAFFTLAKFTSTNLTASVYVFTSFALLSITIFTLFTYIIQLHHPSLKNLAVCFTIFAALIFPPLYGWV